MHKGDVRMSKCPFHKVLENDTIKNAYPEECQDPDRLAIIANDINFNPIETASAPLKWMDDTDNRFANRCLPMLAANELGWVLPCPEKFVATWNGGKGIGDIKIEFFPGEHHTFVESHFGYGVLTFHPGFLFQTTKGHGLYAKGPANRHKNHIYPLEGLVETDWLTFTFTMNWRFTEPDKPVVFEQGEPICQIFPYPREYVSKFDAIKRPMNDDLSKAYNTFSDSRIEFNNDETREGKDWQKNYFRGKYHNGSKCEDFGFKHEPRCGAKKFKQQ
tara:strand:- start:1188 stop:2009 length:822 start_codon:yes stop_codon:yes gene_type:complete